MNELIEQKLHQLQSKLEEKQAKINGEKLYTLGEYRTLHRDIFSLEHTIQTLKELKNGHQRIDSDDRKRQQHESSNIRQQN